MHSVNPPNASQFPPMLTRLCPEDSIPTPPFSPALPSSIPNTPNLALLSTMNVLDDLVQFYEQEQAWISRTRQRLEIVGPFEPTSIDDCPYDEHNEDAEDDEKFGNLSGSSSRWNRRKKDFRLRLDGLGNQSGGCQTIHSQPLPTGQEVHAAIPSKSEILSMYNAMINTRMESCQRLNKLIRDANQANLRTR